MQPVGKFELKQSALNLHFLKKTSRSAPTRSSTIMSLIARWAIWSFEAMSNLRPRSSTLEAITPSRTSWQPNLSEFFLQHLFMVGICSDDYGGFRRTSTKGEGMMLRAARVLEYHILRCRVASETALRCPSPTRTDTADRILEFII